MLFFSLVLVISNIIVGTQGWSSRSDYKISENKEIDLVKQTFDSVYESRKPDRGLILHSDQGKKYRTNEFRTLIKKI